MTQASLVLLKLPFSMVKLPSFHESPAESTTPVQVFRPQRLTSFLCSPISSRDNDDRPRFGVYTKPSPLDASPYANTAGEIRESSSTVRHQFRQVQNIAREVDWARSGREDKCAQPSPFHLARCSQRACGLDRAGATSCGPAHSPVCVCVLTPR